MQTNQYGQTYRGNDDFRGWLAAGNVAPASFNLDYNAPWMGAGISQTLLQAGVGNDGKLGNNYFNDPNLDAYAQAAYNYWNNQRQTQAENPSDDAQSANTANTTTSTSAADQATKNRMIGIYDRQIQTLNNDLDSLDRQLQNSLDSVKGEYDQYKNEQQSSYDAALNDYNNSTKQNQQNLQMNRNDITNRASSGLRGLLRVLGAMGAGGGSVARYEAPAMVTNQANQEYSNAGQTYAQNQQSLDTDWGNYQNEYDNDKKKLEDWYDGQVKSAKQENYEKGQSLLQELAAAYGNRAVYGGDYGNNVDKTYSRIDDFGKKITDLGQYTPANYTGMTAVYNAPDLATYNTGNTNLATTVTDSNTSAASPLLVALQGLNRRRTNSPYSNKTEE